MKMIEINSITGSVPPPIAQHAKYFSDAERSLMLKQIQASVDSKKLFIAEEDGKLVAVGYKEVHEILRVESGEVWLSGSHAVHEIMEDIGNLKCGGVYSLAIDPAYNRIISATPVDKAPLSMGEKLIEKMDLWRESDIEDISKTEANAFFMRVEKQPHIPFLYPADGCWARAN